jgi:hypothetical protein
MEQGRGKTQFKTLNALVIAIVLVELPPVWTHPAESDENQSGRLDSALEATKRNRTSTLVSSALYSDDSIFDLFVGGWRNDVS